MKHFDPTFDADKAARSLAFEEAGNIPAAFLEAGAVRNHDARQARLDELRARYPLTEAQQAALEAIRARRVVVVATRKGRA